MNRLKDWVAETPESITARLEGAKASQAQIRFTLGIMALISMMMLIASYNAYLSYDYNWILESNDRQLTSGKSDKENTPEAANRKSASEKVAETLTEQALKDWAASRIVQISLLGVRVSIDDVAVLGSAVLSVLSFWLLLLARREKYTIGSLLLNTDAPGPESKRDSSATQLTESSRNLDSGGERWRIFHTIISNSLFFTFHSLDGQDRLKPRSARGFKRRLNRVGFALVRSFFFLFPAIASLAVFCLDRWSYFIPDPFDPNFAIPGSVPFFWRSMAVFFVCWIPLTICCWNSRRYSRSTERSLNEYGNKLYADLSQKETFSQH
jgi:hypothetical protein